MVRQQQAEQVVHAVAKCFARRWLIRALEELKERAARDQDEVRDHLHLFGVLNLAHRACLHPVSIVSLEHAHRLVQVRFPFASERGVFFAQVVHLTVEEAEIPERFERLFDELERCRVSAISRLPGIVDARAHLVEEFADDFFFVAEVEVEIARADREVIGDVVRCDGDDS